LCTRPRTPLRRLPEPKMTGTLALVGGGEWSDGCTFDQRLIELAHTDTVAVLPTGSAYENPTAVMERARVWFEQLGAKAIEVPVLTRPDAFVPEYIEVVRSSRFTYLAGTSAMHLRSVLKDSPLFEALVGAYQSGGVLAGTNAGADVLCDPMVDARGGAFTVGLGVVSNLAVIPRSNTWSHDKIHRTVALAPPGLAVAEIPEATALIRDPDGLWHSEGVGEVQVYIDRTPARLADLKV
ncbi:MAG: Type 1 glutamine amidotransferase-like domain-containing protein, partial [Acidimicrobiales bacterium]|nr:Type 1 glutamine amidotransferase-like domain-containing protein [Acidimicrobiales bacterium]